MISDFSDILLDRRKPVVILYEGLLGYLTFEQKRQVFANVREMLHVYGGVWITSDLDTLDKLEQMHNIRTEFQQLVQTVQTMTGSSLKDNTFTSFEEVERFALEQGFDIKRDEMLDLLPQLTCLQPLEIPVEVAESILANSSVSVLTLCEHQ
jgi:O-methyltransferase involved in polyketide biosynthesis